MENIKIDINKEFKGATINYKLVGLNRFKYKVYLTDVLIRIINQIGVVKLEEIA